MTDKIDVVETGRDTWLEHAYTKAQAKKAADASRKALALLLNVCANSKDPDVLSAYGKWSNQRNLAEVLGATAEDLGGVTNGK